MLEVLEILVALEILDVLEVLVELVALVRQVTLAKLATSTIKNAFIIYRGIFEGHDNRLHPTGYAKAGRIL